jgi:hypothetical protein
MIEPIKPADFDVSTLSELAQGPGRIKQAHLPPFIKSRAIRLPPATHEDLEQARECLPPRI